MTRNEKILIDKLIVAAKDVSQVMQHIDEQTYCCHDEICPGKDDCCLCKLNEAIKNIEQTSNRYK